MRAGITTVAGCLLIVMGAALFIWGYFPTHVRSAPGNRENTIHSSMFRRAVFILVDGMRSDLVYSDSSPMDYTKGLIRSHIAVPFVARADPPTVTLPRLKVENI